MMDPAAQGQINQKIEEFFALQKEDLILNAVDLKASTIPIARIRKVMKSDPDYKVCLIIKINLGNGMPCLNSLGDQSRCSRRLGKTMRFIYSGIIYTILVGNCASKSEDFNESRYVRSCNAN
jgi:hypothetical protein